MLMSIKDLGELMKQAQEAQGQFQEIRSQIDSLEITGESGGGLVRILMNGRYEVGKVTIDPALKQEEMGVVEDLIAAACNDAVHKVERAQADKMSDFAGGLRVPLGSLKS